MVSSNNLNKIQYIPPTLASSGDCCSKEQLCFALLNIPLPPFFSALISLTLISIGHCVLVSKAFLLTPDLSHLSCGRGMEIALRVRALPSFLPTVTFSFPKDTQETPRRSKPWELKVVFPREQALHLVGVNGPYLRFHTKTGGLKIHHTPYLRAFLFWQNGWSQNPCLLNQPEARTVR